MGPVRSNPSDPPSGEDRSPEALQRAQARRWLQAEHAHRLREQAAALGLGEELSRLSDHEVLQLWSAGQPLWGRTGQRTAVPLRLAPKPVPAAASPAPGPAPAPRAARAAVPDAPIDVQGTLSADVDAAAMARSLREAANDGVPFCEECSRVGGR